MDEISPTSILGKENFISAFKLNVEGFLDPAAATFSFELVWIVLSLGLAFSIYSHPPKKLLRFLGSFQERVQTLLPSLILFLSLATGKAILTGMRSLSWDSMYLDTALSLSTVFLAFVFMKGSKLTGSQRAYILFFLLAVLALFMTDNAQAVIGVLNEAKLTLGNFSLSLWVALKTITVFAFLLWAAININKRVRIYMGRHRKFSPTARELIFKINNILAFVITIVIALNMLGIDFTALTVFSGALGIGLGFGLKSIASNLFSGLILLMDKSIKPGDVISIDGEYGVITEMNARYCVLRTRDGTELLLPNEKLMTIDVINWSYSSKNIRQKLKLGVSYNSDVDRVQRIMLEVARAHKRVIRAPAPRAFIVEFGSSAIEFELRYWIKDPEEGLANVRSDLFFAIWKAFKKEGIEIPFNQLVLHQAKPKAEEAVQAHPAEE